MVRVHLDPPLFGAIAQLGEHLLCKQGVVGSIPTGSTTSEDVKTQRTQKIKRNDTALRPVLCSLKM